MDGARHAAAPQTLQGEKPRHHCGLRAGARPWSRVSRGHFYHRPTRPSLVCSWTPATRPGFLDSGRPRNSVSRCRRAQRARPGGSPRPGPPPPPRPPALACQRRGAHSPALAKAPRACRSDRLSSRSRRGGAEPAAAPVEPRAPGPKRSQWASSARLSAPAAGETYSAEGNPRKCRET
ncbi:uncharacterized protein LOC115072833 [Nannospalax galili]|uniref:uncharacterized protein LOC115072833 n=1 Tax=Nannospalax galili TaxID=1026970 RepID=UPI00111BFB09|nr:uncharacterized protein LOC115072833 [Nannospalax galili]